MLIYLLFEHQREEGPLIALRLLHDMVRIWERRVETGKPLAPILPVVLAQNSER